MDPMVTGWEDFFPLVNNCDLAHRLISMVARFTCSQDTHVQFCS